VCGDENNDVLTVTGVGSKWFEVYVAECVSSLISYPDLSFTAIIDSPPGMNYDMYVYKGDDGGPNCSAAPTKASGVPERVMDGWGDSMGSEDGTWLSIEVRYVSGTDCEPTDTWTLRVEGNT
jgi:hypothetical protein